MIFNAFWRMPERCRAAHGSHTWISTGVVIIGRKLPQCHGEVLEGGPLACYGSPAGSDELGQHGGGVHWNFRAQAPVQHCHRSLHTIHSRKRRRPSRAFPQNHAEREDVSFLAVPLTRHHLQQCRPRLGPQSLQQGSLICNLNALGFE